MNEFVRRWSLASLVLFSYLFDVSAQSTETDWSQINAQIEDSISARSFIGAKELAGKYLLKARQNSNDTLLTYFHFAIALGHYRQDTRLGIKYLDSAIALSKIKSHHEMYTRASNAKSTFLKRLGDLEEAKLISLKVYNYVVDNSLNTIFESARNLSIIYRRHGMYDSALFYISIADSMADGSPNPYLKYLTVQGAANIYEQMGKYRLSISKNKNLLKLADTDPNFMNTWLNLGLSYNGLNMLDSAFFSYEKSLGFAIKIADTIEMANLHWLIAEINYKNETYTDAISNIEKSLYYSQFDESEDIIASSNLTLAKVNIAQGNFKEAVKSAQKSLLLTREMSMPQQEIEVLDVLSQALFKAGDHSKAYEIVRAFEKLKSEFNNKDRIAKIEELQTRYETQLKDKEINELNTRTAIQDLRLQQKNLAIAIGIIVGLVLILSIIFIYKQRIAKEQRISIDMKQKLLRSQLNPHFIFNALAAIQQFIYQKKNPVETGDYLGKFSQLTRMILNHTEKDLITLEEEIEFINNYLALQKLRFDEPFDYQVLVDDNLEIEEVMVPPMVTQPFIENSIEHGILHKQEKGEIEVVFKEQNGLLKITLHDNGIGREKATFMKRNQEHRSMATQITLERLKTLQKVFRKKANLAIDDITDSEEKVIGTQVIVNLPLIFQN